MEVRLTNPEGYLSKRLKGLRKFWITYKTLSSALSLTSDREWSEATMPGEYSQVEEKRGANGIF